MMATNICPSPWCRRLGSITAQLVSQQKHEQHAVVASGDSRLGQPVTITGIRTRDIRFALPEGDGTDSVHSLGGRIYYGYGVTVLETSTGAEAAASPPTLQGDGLGFTLGAGTDMVCSAIEHLSKPLIGREIEDLMASFGTTFNALAEHPALRWLGPHNGIIHLAIASIANACFDLWAKSRGQPLWKLLLSLSDEQVVDLLDLSYLDDVMTREEALQLLALERPTRAERESVLATGIPGYDTSAGWMDCTDEEITERSRGAVEQGFKAVKLKVGGLEVGSEQRDLHRLGLVSDAVGDKIRIAFDANQQWTVEQAIHVSGLLSSVVKPLFIEEPTHPHDVAAHAAIAAAIHPTPIAVGESIPNRVVPSPTNVLKHTIATHSVSRFNSDSNNPLRIQWPEQVFKNFMAAGAVQVCQIDPTRLGGVGEAIACALMARKLKLRVIPHVGDMGQLSQHLCLFYHVALGLQLEFLEYIPHLREYFVNPAKVREGRYVVPDQPGASTSIVSEQVAARIIASGEPTHMHEGATNLGDE
jgi:L-fuconate dehydratase